MPLEKLYERLSNMKSEDFYLIEADFFTALSAIPIEKRPTCVTAFLTISNWYGISLRSGVWTFYEVCNNNEAKLVSVFLQENNLPEMSSMFALGMHDYQNPQYAENFNYPEEWIKESEIIDAWIDNNQNHIIEQQINLLNENRELICSLQSMI